MPMSGTHRGPHVVVTESPESAVLEPERNDLLHDEQDEKKTARSEERIMEAEEELELERWPVLHPCLNTEDDDEVCGEGREHLLRRRKRRLALHIVRQVVGNTKRR